MTSGVQILLNNIADKILAPGWGFCIGLGFVHCGALGNELKLFDISMVCQKNTQMPNNPLNLFDRPRSRYVAL
jgi:hypothetical protein